jgi:hypothetical protein
MRRSQIAPGPAQIAFFRFSYPQITEEEELLHEWKLMHESKLMCTDTLTVS